MSTPLNKYHPVLIRVHVYSAMTTKLAIILILRNATRIIHIKYIKINIYNNIYNTVLILQYINNEFSSCFVFCKMSKDHRVSNAPICNWDGVNRPKGPSRRLETILS